MRIAQRPKPAFELAFFIPTGEPVQNETAAAVARTAPSWVATALAWGDTNFPRILLVLSIMYTAAQLYALLARLWKGGARNGQL